MLVRKVLTMFLFLTITLITGCTGNKTLLEIEIGEKSCSGISFIDETGGKSIQNTQEIQAGTLELSVVNKGYERSLILIAAQDFPSVEDLPSTTIFLNDRDGFQPVVSLDALTKDQLLVTQTIAKGAVANITVKLNSGSYWILNPDGIFCENPLVLKVIP